MQSQGDSLRRQFQRCNEAIIKNNLYVKEQITDEAFSGFHGDNLISGKLKDFIDRAIDGDIEKDAFLIVENLDRITRLQPSKAVNIITKILSSGLEIYQTSPECLFSFKNKKDEAMTIIMITLFAQRAHEESDTKSGRIKEAWLARIERIMSGEQKILMDKPPYWLNIVEKDFDVNGETKRLKCYEINQEKTDEVLALLELLKSMGIKEACKQINATAAKKWTVKGVQRLLESKSLYGDIDLKLSIREDGKYEKQSRGLELPQIYPPIITRKEFDEILALIKLRSGGRGAGRKSTKFHNIFSKLIYCSFCGGAYRYMHKTNYNYLVCYNSEVHMCKYEKVLSFRYPDIEAAFFNYAGYFNLNSFKIFKKDDDTEYAKIIEEKQAELVAKRESFANMFNSIMEKNNGVISPLFQSSLDMTEKGIINLEKEIEELKQKEILSPVNFVEEKSAIILDPEILGTPIGRAKMNAHLKRIIERIEVKNIKHSGDKFNEMSVKFIGVDEPILIKFRATKSGEIEMNYDDIDFDRDMVMDILPTKEQWESSMDELDNLF